MFQSSNFSADNGVLAGVQFALTGVTVFGAIFVQNVLGYTPIEAGLSLLPLTLPLLFLAPLAGRAYDRIGPRGLVAGGALLIGAGLIWSAAVLDKVSFSWLVPGYLAIGVGLALVMTPASTDCMNTAPAKLRGEASGVMQTVRQVGGTVGLAIMGTIIAHVEADEPSADAFTSGVSSAYYVGGAVMVAVAVVALVVLRHVKATDEPEGATEQVAIPTPAHAGAHPHAAS